MINQRDEYVNVYKGWATSTERSKAFLYDIFNVIIFHEIFSSRCTPKDFDYLVFKGKGHDFFCLEPNGGRQSGR